LLAFKLRIYEVFKNILRICICSMAMAVKQLSLIGNYYCVRYHHDVNSVYHQRHGHYSYDNLCGEVVENGFRIIQLQDYRILCNSRIEAL